MEMTKEALLSFANYSTVDDLQHVRDVAYARLAEINAVDVGFRPFPKSTVPGETPTKSSVLLWIETVRQPRGSEMSNRQVRNRLVYEVEKLGEFAESLQFRILLLLSPQ